MLIDAHQHFWLLKDRQGQWPPASLEAIYRDFLPADLQPLLEKAGVSGTVLVQTMESAADTDFMLALADDNSFIKGVVGWVDMKAADAPQDIARLASHRALKGVRPMLQDIADVQWIDDPALDPAVEALVEKGLVFDALVLPPHLPYLLRFASRHPALKIVIDHGAKAQDRDRSLCRMAERHGRSCRPAQRLLQALRSSGGARRSEARSGSALC